MRCRVVVVAALLAGAGGWGPTDAHAVQCGSEQRAAGLWSAVDVPPTPSLPVGTSSAILSTTIVGRDRSVVLATDGVSVFRSTDGGCRWKTTYTVGAADYYSDDGYVSAYGITNIASSHTAAPANRQDVYLALSPTPLEIATVFAAALPEQILASHDGGQTFALAQPAPTAANPIVPECQNAPHLMVVPPTDSRTIYLQCNGGVTQEEVDDQLAGGTYFAYRSRDGGQSWSLIPLPVYSDSGEPFQPGMRARELWSASEPDYILTVWHSVDDGAHWTKLSPTGRPGIGLGQITVAVDPGSLPTAEHLVVYTPNGGYATTDSGKHWTALRGLEPAGYLRPMLAFYLRHSLYVVAATSFHQCTTDPVVLRYADVTRKPVQAPVPTKWGLYVNWGHQGSITAVNGAEEALGIATFCTPATSQPKPSKLLSVRPG